MQIVFVRKAYRTMCLMRDGCACSSRAIGAHQAHGAIGFTHEYNLHPLTRRLWTWRSEFGGDSFWAAVVGAHVTTAGAERFWPDLTALTD